MFLRTLGLSALLVVSSQVYAQECSQELLKGRWQLQLTRLYGEDGLGLRCTLRVKSDGTIGARHEATSCNYALENTPNVKGSVTITDNPKACWVDVALEVSGGDSGRVATLQSQMRLNYDRDYADKYDAVLEDQDGTEIFSGPISFYKY